MTNHGTQYSTSTQNAMNQSTGWPRTMDLSAFCDTKIKQAASQIPPHWSVLHTHVSRNPVGFATRSLDASGIGCGVGTVVISESRN